ncbi:RING-H2 finger protein ATL80-like [Pyrus ussuriensis x Pyrus communis]|uniref:RING-type E3 ubiquitin transferase n=1 Tax=Pyrus ussuriensis x Pyrus communis TaxID=2448454 RepID=A0A5N5HBW5_9ROSA|nr:RING-H2 finger protein ATL80 [Pyrus x bretschneideri]KAB2623622.1 RING-H2 finger protein ATL80-like [Pyrus ussuriensis x Pyrus communis]
MPRFQRFLGSSPHSANFSNITAAPPPEAVALESDFVVILAALLCAVICVVGLLAVARCAWLRRVSGGRAAIGSASSSANKGLKKKVLQSLPKFTYGTGGAEPPPKLGSECAICLGEFAEGHEIRVLPQCGHVFHVGCIDTWLGSHSSCPSCRQILVVARCHKCGGFPAPVSEAELKAHQDHTNRSAPPPAAAAAAAPSTAVSISSNTATTTNFLP